MNSWETFKRAYEASIKEQLVPVEMMKNESGIIIIDAEMYASYRLRIEEGLVFYKNPEEQEKEMKTKVFEYCITDFNGDGDAIILVGPELIVIEAEGNQENLVLVQIGQRHADEITPESTVLVRPFC